VAPVRSNLARATAAAVFVAGAGVRLEHYLTRRSLWLDEAMLANNIVGRGYGDLLRRLDNDQAAPAGFLWLERLCVQVLGTNEYALRLIPLIAGVAVLPLVWSITRRNLGEPAAAAATAFVALSPMGIRYSTEVKQYSSDAFVVLAVIAVVCMIAGNLTVRRAWLFAATGAVAVWISHPAWFAVAVGGLVLARTKRVRALLIAGGPIVASALVAYAVNLRHVRGNDALESYWSGGYPPKSASVFGAIRWVFRASWDVLEQPGGVDLRLVAIGLLLVGVGALRRHDRRLALLIGGVVGVALLAAVVRIYPVQGRLVLYAVPLLAMVLSAGLARRVVRWPVTFGIAVVLFAPIGDVLDLARHPPVFVEGRQAIEYIAEHRRSSEEIYVHSTAAPVFEFYAERLQLDADGVVTCAAEEATPPTNRAWLLYAYTLSTHPRNEQALIGRWFGGGAKPLRAYYGEDASARLYAPTAAPTVACRSLPGPVRK
jgi:hypothetical protein